MKKMIGLVLAVLMISTLFTACTQKNEPATMEGRIESGDKTTPPPGMGITVNKIKFEEITDENSIPKELKDKIEEKKQKQGFEFVESNGEYFLAVFAGERNTGGYSIKVTAVEDNEGKTNVFVEETKPAKDAMVTQAITYPYTVVKMTGIAPNFNIVFSEAK